jgi:hypothetical protein
MNNTTTLINILSSDYISDTITNINTNYATIHLSLSGIEEQYGRIFSPILNYCNKYVKDIYDSYNLYMSNSAYYNDFITNVQSNSANWLQPFTIFYPNLIQTPYTDDDVNVINEWIRKYFPIKNSDNTLNYVEGQKFIVSFYTYTYGEPFHIIDQPYSYNNCSTANGTIYLHCKTIITGGQVVCNQGSYNCNTTINCYPSQNVECWYTSPYLHTDGTQISNNDPLSTRQSVIGKIQANIIMNYTERKENQLNSIIFTVSDCDWAYKGVYLS